LGQKSLGIVNRIRIQPEILDLDQKKTSVADPNIVGPPQSGILLWSSKNSKKNLDSYCFVTSLWLFSLNIDVNIASKSNNKQKNFKNFFVAVFKVRGTDPRIRIRTKMSQIRNSWKKSPDSQLWSHNQSTRFVTGRLIGILQVIDKNNIYQNREFTFKLQIFDLSQKYANGC
jgi:hypothetical protein